MKTIIENKEKIIDKLYYLFSIIILIISIIAFSSIISFNFQNNKKEILKKEIIKKEVKIVKQ